MSFVVLRFECLDVVDYVLWGGGGSKGQVQSRAPALNLTSVARQGGAQN